MAIVWEDLRFAIRGAGPAILRFDKLREEGNVYAIRGAGPAILRFDTLREEGNVYRCEMRTDVRPYVRRAMFYERGCQEQTTPDLAAESFSWQPAP